MRSTTPRSIALYILLSFSSLNIATASPAEAYAWPAGIDPGEKYWPLGTGPPSKRWLQEFVESSGFNQSSAKCSGVKKLSSEDPSEKFYWDWEHLARSQQGFLGLGTSAGEKSEDVSAELPVNAYRAPHRDIVSDHGIIGVLLGKRQTFECAVGTQSCSAVGVPGSCCDLTETCERIPDIGFGNIGCCPKGQTCSGNLSGCGTDKKTCSGSQGGGCCTSNYECSPNGCILAGGGASVTASTCTSGFYACPTHVAGGCCPSGRLCGVSDCPSATTTGGGAVVTPGDTCPTGYYTCAAQYNGGCCRIGRDCAITDCPERVLTIGNGDAGAGGIVTTALGGCASGWQTCGGGMGGGCCPTGYQCGATDCPAVTIMVSNVISGQIFTTNVVLPATSKIQPTSLAGIPIPPSNNALRRSGRVTQVIVVVAVVVGVVANT